MAGPAFNEQNYALNWVETLRVAHEWFEEVDTLQDKNAKEGALLDMKEVTEKIALLVISAAGFGIRTSWSTLETLSSDRSSFLSKSKNRNETVLPFYATLALSIEKIFEKALTPNFMYNLPFGLRIPWFSDELDLSTLAFSSMKKHMLEIVADARSDSEEGSQNLLRRLVKANDALQAAGGEAAKGTLTDEELLGNIFVEFLR